MSGDSRPSSVQPPIDNTYADTMAQVRHPPKLPTLANFTGYADHHDTPLFSNPQFRPSPRQDQSQASVRLPPIRMSPNETFAQRSSQPFSISSLLAEQDQPSRQNASQIPHGSRPLSRRPTDSPVSSYGESPGQSASQWHPGSGRMGLNEAPSRRAGHAHYLDHPPSLHRSPGHVSQPYGPYHKEVPPLRHSYTVPIKTEQPYHQLPPDPRSYSGSHYTSSSEPSPSATSAVPLHIPPPRRVAIPPLNYDLSIRQQPAAARACGFGERDRRVVDPPPILELKITDKATGKPAQDPGCILAMHCALLNQDGSDENEIVPAGEGMPSTRRLMGTIVASPYQAKDETGVAGTFFVFPDLSCRSPGKYRLGFKLLRVDIMSMGPGTISPSVASATSDVFSVYTAKDFPGMRASSALLKALRRQGLNVGVKKGSEARKGKTKAKSKKGGDLEGDEDDSDGGAEDEDEMESDEEEDDDDGSNGDVSPKAATRRKGKRRKMATARYDAQSSS